jgi:hypothetical protein
LSRRRSLTFQHSEPVVQQHDRQLRPHAAQSDPRRRSSIRIAPDTRQQWRHNTPSTHRLPNFHCFLSW